MSIVRFTGSVDLRAYRRAYRAVGKPGPILRWLYTIVATPLVVAFAALSIKENDPSPLIGAAFLLMLAGVVWLAPEQAARAAVRRNKLAQENLSGDATAERLRLTSRFGTVELPWSVFCGAKRTKSLVLLFQEPAIATIFPREYFSTDDEFQQFSHWAMEGVPQQSWVAPALKWGIFVAVLSALVVYAILNQ